MTKKRIIWVDMDDTICQYKEAFSKAIKENPYNKYPQSEYGFFRKLKPIKDAIKIVNLLDITNDVRILTRPSFKNPMSYTEKREWVETHLGLSFCQKLYFSPDKTVEVKKDDILIDNTEYNVKGKLIQFGVKPFESWNKVYEYLKNN